MKNKTWELALDFQIKLIDWVVKGLWKAFAIT